MAIFDVFGQKWRFSPFWGILGPLGVPRDPGSGGVLHQPLAPGPRGSRGARAGASAAQARGTPPEEGQGVSPWGSASGPRLTGARRRELLLVKV